ncbi:MULTISPECIES: hypothetical protein [unclassified Gemella]|nr:MULTISPECIES: hypothetical protein [unclassified Gemella]
MEKNPFLYRDKSRERYVAGGEKQSKAYKIIDKNLKKNILKHYVI